MSRLRIVGLAHRATWSEIANSEKKSRILSLKQGCSCWIDVNGSRGKRSGIYRINSNFNRENFVAASFVSDSQINEEYKCLEKILQERVLA